MKIIIKGIEPEFKIYKMSESIEGKFYIGKTKQSLKDRMYGHQHSHALVPADDHFADVGWRNVTVEIIDSGNDEEEMNKKEIENISKCASKLMLNKNYNNETKTKPLKRKCNNLCSISQNTKELLIKRWSELRITTEQETEILNKTNNLTLKEQEIIARYIFNSNMGITKPITDDNADEYKALLRTFIGSKYYNVMNLIALLSTTRKPSSA